MLFDLEELSTEDLKEVGRLINEDLGWEFIKKLGERGRKEYDPNEEQDTTDVEEPAAELTPEEAAEAERKRRVKEIQDRKKREREDKLIEEDDKARAEETPTTPTTPTEPAPAVKTKKVRRLAPKGKTQAGDDLDYLPAGTVIVDSRGTEWTKKENGTWNQSSGPIGGTPWRQNVTLDPADGYEIKEIPGYDENAPGTGVVEDFVSLHKKREGDYVKQKDGTWKRIVKVERKKRQFESDKAGKMALNYPELTKDLPFVIYKINEKGVVYSNNAPSKLEEKSVNVKNKATE
jgi:hypothetical protein